jgi:hypothetical protein
MFSQKRAHPLSDHGRMLSWSLQSLMDYPHKFGYIRGFYDVIVHLIADRFQSGLERGISRDNDGDCVGLCTPHGAYHGKSVSRLANIQVREQYIELFGIDRLQCFWNRTGAYYLEAVHFQYRRKSQPDRGLIIHEQDTGANFTSHNTTPYCEG